MKGCKKQSKRFGRFDGWRGFPETTGKNTKQLAKRLIRTIDLYSLSQDLFRIYFCDLD